MVTNWNKIKIYINNRERGKIIAVLGHNNLGHYLVNALSGIEKHLDELGSLSKVDKLLVHGPEYFSPTDDLFPEIPSEKIERVTKTELSQEILEKNYFIFRLGNDCVSENLADKIDRASLKQCSPSFLAQVEEAKKRSPLLYISFRLYKRAWVSQIEGIANIIGKLFADFPKLGVVFDGFSLGSSNAEMEEKHSTFVKEQIEKENAVVKQILAILVDKNIRTYNTVGCRMHESIVWANAVDFYIASLGSNMTKVCTVANKPGIGHTNTAYIGSAKRWFENKRANAIAPIIVPDSHIIDLEKEKGISGNYDLDWKVIYDEAMKLIPQLSRTS